jgi:hypothetical protein
MPNIHSEPEAFGLTAFGEVEFSSGSYEFDTLVVWRDATGAFLYAEDSGCSCPEPFGQIDLRTVKRATAHEIAARIQERQRARDANYGGVEPPTYGSDQAAALIERLMQARPNREQQ